MQRFELLRPDVTDTSAPHDQVVHTGVVCSRASGPIGRHVARRLGLHDNGCQTMRLVVEALVPGDPLSPTRWTRTFGDRSWSTTMSIEPDASVVERLGSLGLRFTAQLEPDRLRLILTGIGLGARWWIGGPLPVSVMVDVATAGRCTATTVDVRLPNGLGLLHYVAHTNEESDGGDEQ